MQMKQVEELVLQSLEPPEERQKVQTAIGAARAEQMANEQRRFQT